MVVWTHGNRGVVLRETYADRPRNSGDPDDEFCRWGDDPRWEISDGSGTVLDVGSFDTFTDPSAPDEFFGPLTSLDPPRCELRAEAELLTRPDVLTVTVTGRTVDFPAYGAETWESSVTLDDDEYDDDTIEVEASQLDMVEP